MGSGLGSMSKLTNRMGAERGRGRCCEWVFGWGKRGEGGVAVKKMIEKGLIWRLFWWKKCGIGLILNFNLFFNYPGIQSVEKFTYFPASPNPRFK